MTPTSREPDQAATAYKARGKWQFTRWFNVAGTLSVSKNNIVFEPNILSRITMLSLAHAQLRSIDDLVGSDLCPAGWKAIKQRGPVGARRLVSLRFRNSKGVTILVKDPDALLNALSSTRNV